MASSNFATLPSDFNLQAAQQAAASRRAAIAQPTTKPVNPVTTGQGTNPNAAPNINITPQTQVQNNSGVTPPPNQTPWLNANGTPNLSYVPTSKNDQAITAVDPYTANIYSANYLKSQGVGVDASKLPTSFEDQANQQLTQETKEKTLLDEQVNKAKADAFAKQRANEGALTTQFAQNREGVMSTANPMVASTAISSMQAQTNALTSQLDQQKEQLAQAQQGNDQKLVQQLTDQVTQTQQKAQQLQIQQNQETQQALTSLNQAGVLAGASPEQLQAYSQQYGISPEVLKGYSMAATRSVLSDQQKNQQDLQTKGLASMTSIFQQGSDMKPQDIYSMAQSMNVPVDLAMAAYNGYAQVRNDKTLDAAGKTAANQKVTNEVNQQLNGIYTDAARNQAYFTQQVQQINSNPNLNPQQKQQQISDLAQGLKLDNSNNPMTQADLKIKQAQATIDTKHANGQAVTPQDWSALADAQSKQIDMGINPIGGSGGNTAYVPNSPIAGMQVSYSGGKLNVQTPVGKDGKPVPFDCGAGVNRVWGLPAAGTQGMGSKIEEKEDLVNRNGIKSSDITDPNSQIIPGMAFVLALPSTSKYAYSGHTGLVKQNLGNGTFLTAEWNADGKGGYSEQTRNVNQVYGFANPPSGAASLTNADGTNKAPQQLGLSQVMGMSSKQLTDGLADGSIDLAMMTPKALEHVKNAIGADQLKSIQDANASGGTVASTKMTNDDIDNAAKAVLDGKATPSQYKRFASQVQARAQQLDTSGTFDPNTVEASEKSRLANAADFQKVQLNADSSSKLIDSMIAKQAKAFGKNNTGPLEWLTSAVGGQAGRSLVNQAHENAGSTAFSGLKSKLSDLSGQIGQVASSGNATHSEQLNSIVKSIDFNQTPEQFAQSLKGLKEVMDTKVNEMKAASANVRRGTYDGQAAPKGDDKTHLGYTAPAASQKPYALSD